eukprot:10485_1
MERPHSLYDVHDSYNILNAAVLSMFKNVKQIIIYTTDNTGCDAYSFSLDLFLSQIISLQSWTKITIIAATFSRNKSWISELSNSSIWHYIQAEYTKKQITVETGGIANKYWGFHRHENKEHCLVMTRCNSEILKQPQVFESITETDHYKDGSVLDSAENINRLCIHARQARNLPSNITKSYVKIKIKNSESQSKTISTANPIWNTECHEEEKELFKQVHKVYLQVFNEKHIFIGGCEIKTQQNPSIRAVEPVRWIPLTNRENEPILGLNGKPSAVQIKCKYTLNVYKHDIRPYTHVIAVTIVNAKLFGNIPYLAKYSKPLTLEIGSQKHVLSDSQAKWLLVQWQKKKLVTLRFFIDQQIQSKQHLKITFGEHGDLGVGFVSLNKVLNHSASNWKVNLGTCTLNFGSSWGVGEPHFELDVEIKLQSKQQFQVGFYQKLFNLFRRNDGIIDKQLMVDVFKKLRIHYGVIEMFDTYHLNDLNFDNHDIVQLLIAGFMRKTINKLCAMDIVDTIIKFIPKPVIVNEKIIAMLQMAKFQRDRFVTILMGRFR